MSKMLLPDITEQLIRLHKRYSDSRHSNKDSQMCNLWSTDNPPNILENTPQLEAIEDALDFSFEEEEAVEFYDMRIEKAAAYICALMNERKGKN